MPDAGTLIAIPASALPDMWSAAAPFIAKACAESNGKFEPADVARALVQQDFQLWGEVRDGELIAILLTRITNYPRLRACELLACVGSGAGEWTPQIAQIEAWARANHCDLMQPIARKGWERALKPHGYVATHVMLEKRLS